MEQHEKNEDIPKRLRLMKKRLKQALALVGILIIILALSSCEKFVETDVSAETKNIIQTVSETTIPANQEENQFVTDLFDTVDKLDIEISDEIAALPDIKSIGNVYSLRNAMALDETGELNRNIIGITSQSLTYTGIKSA